MSEEFLKWLARKAVAVGTPPVVADAVDDVEEMQEASRTVGEAMDLDAAWRRVERNGEAIDKVMNPIRSAKRFMNALKRRG